MERAEFLQRCLEVLARTVVVLDGYDSRREPVGETRKTAYEVRKLMVEMQVELDRLSDRPVKSWVGREVSEWPALQERLRGREHDR